MKKGKNLIGQRFGRLTVVKHVEKSCWECICDCGTKKITNTSALNAGYTKSCGCLKKETDKIGRNTKFRYLGGQKFGKLIALEYIKGSRWKCKCDCGNIINVRTGDLKSGRTKSCGCLVKKHGFKSTKDPQKRKFYRLWGSIRKHSKDIMYDSRWDDFLEFKKDMYFKYLYAIKQQKVKNITFGRKNVNKGYDKENCIFITRLDKIGQIKGKVFEDLTGKKFGKLIAVKYADGRWECKCDCGGVNFVTRNNLESGHTKSCGCFRGRYIESGFYNKDSLRERTFFLIWRNLRARCNNTNLKCYKNYGGRGIAYDPRWDDFLVFKKDMYFKYLYAIKQQKLKKASIERIDVNGNYCFENCIFIELSDQLKNTRSVITFIAISPEGKRFIERNVNQFAREYGLNSSHVYECMQGKANTHKGWRFKKSKLTLKQC